MKWELKGLKRQIKSQILNNLSESQTVKLTFTKAEFNNDSEVIFHSSDNEIEIENNMYDIIHVEVIGDIYSFTCYPDTKESAFKKKIRQYVASLYSQDPQKAHQTKNFLQYLSQLFCQDLPIYSFLQNIPAISLSNFTFKDEVSGGYKLSLYAPPDWS